MNTCNIVICNAGLCNIWGCSIDTKPRVSMTIDRYSSVESMSKEDAAYWTKQLEEYYYQKEYVGEDNPRTKALKTMLIRKGLLNEDF